MFTLRYKGGDPVVNSQTGQPWSSQHAVTARSAARHAAKTRIEPVQVMRGARVAYVMHPDGSTTPPPGAIEPPRMNCTRGSGRPCFCQPCRDDRKAAR